MTKTHRKGASTAEVAFNRHYATIWGEERWNNSLYPALLKPTRYACLLNRYTNLDEAKRRISDDDQASTVQLSLPMLNQADQKPPAECGYKPNCFVRAADVSIEQAGASSFDGLDVSFPPPASSSATLMSHWNMDAASILVTHLLDVQPGDNILDLCAAPGGKSIAIAQRLWPHLHIDQSPSTPNATQKETLRLSTLHSNEADGTRQRRLAENLKAYLPKSLFDANQVRVWRIDGSKPNVEYELRVKTPNGTTGYNKVLIDAPCSSERHIIHAHAKAISGGRVADEMANWRSGSSKRLAGTQIDLLMTGLRTANIGGTIIYATCSIEPTENDGVVEKVLAHVEKERKKRGLKWNVTIGLDKGQGDGSLEAALEQNWAERTKYGWIVLPDHPAGGRWGPLFFTVFNKTQTAT